MSDDRGGRQTAHVLTDVMSGPTRKPPGKRVRLKVVGPVWMPLDGIPAGGRDECRNGERPCRYIKCRHHLWRLDPDRPGPRWRGPLATTLAARWLEYPTPACCALDIADAVIDGELGDITEIATAMGTSVDWTRRLIRRALKKLRTLAPEEIDEP